MNENDITTGGNALNALIYFLNMELKKEPFDEAKHAAIIQAMFDLDTAKESFLSLKQYL